MKKNGWGLRAELGFILLFIFCLLIATVGLHKLGLIGGDNDALINLGEYTTGTGNFDYQALEDKVTIAAKKYYKDKYPYGSSDTVIVSISTLKNNGYISGIYDSRNKECKGYAKILKTNNCISYIKCSVYKTSGYSEEYE